MKIADLCPLCGNGKCASHWASVSRFLRERMFESRGPKGCRVLYCEQCDFYFFNIRPDDSEMQLFYQGYRSDQYQRQREKYEANYTTEFNASLGTHPMEIANRVAIMEGVLQRNGVSCGVDVLDYGGNEGRLIPESITGKKYCYDLSDNKTLAGVTKVTKSELDQHAYGMIMLQHVLEHISYPAQFLKDAIVPLMGDESCLYIELPYEIELVQPLLDRNRTLYYALKNRFKLHRPDWFLASLPFTSGPEFHEHINGFSLASIPHLLAAAGLESLDSQILELDAGWCQVKIIYCLACTCTVHPGS